MLERAGGREYVLWHGVTSNPRRDWEVILLRARESWGDLTCGSLILTKVHGGPRLICVG